MTDYTELVKWCRSWDDEKMDEVADAIEALEREREEFIKLQIEAFKRAGAGERL